MSPAIIIPPNDAAQCDNFMLRENFIATRPSFTQLLNSTPDGHTIYGIMPGTQPFSFSSGYFFYVMTSNNLYRYNSLTGGLTLNGALPASPIARYFDYVNTLSSTVFVNGGQGVCQVIGVNAPIEVTGGKYGAAYIMELAQSLLIANTVEAGGISFPQRLRWCAPSGPGNPGDITKWDPFVYTGAGFIDILDASDVITGMIPMGSVGYVLRTNGITQISPTGNGVSPWYLNHLWASQKGIGQVFAQTKAQYGALCFLLAEDNVYVFTPNSLTTVGDKVIDSIIVDIYTFNNNGNFGGGAFQPYTDMYACLVPRYAGNYRYFCYKLFIWNNSGTPQGVCWTYDLNSKNWVREVYSGVGIGGHPEYVYVPKGGFPNNIDGLYFFFNQTINYFDPTNLNTEQPATYKFKVEQQVDLGYNEVSWVSVRYKNIGLGTLTVSIDGPAGTQSSTLVLGDNTKNKFYYNGAQQPLGAADGKSYYAYFSYHPVTDASFQVSLSRPANGGPLQIEQVTVLSEFQEESR